MGAPEHSVADAVRIVETDPALTALVLRTVNSAAYGLRVSIESVKRAVSFLGSTAVLGIAMNQSAGGLFNKPLEGYDSARGALWAHCLRTAIGARELARACGIRMDQDAAYTAGLLHDIGKAVLDEWLAGETEELVRQAEAAEENFDREEREHLHTDHAEVGALLLEEWG
ncbi:MAG: HDOD domain-containing protein, partial [Planctomycetes bacterium]|nr:HDOD domain-containing protein [Planctomycetota bacterium]